MSKVSSEILNRAVDNLLAFSAGGTVNIDGKELKGKERKFTESIELQVTILHNVMGLTYL